MYSITYLVKWKKCIRRNTFFLKIALRLYSVKMTKILSNRIPFTIEIFNVNSQ